MLAEWLTAFKTAKTLWDNKENIGDIAKTFHSVIQGKHQNVMFTGASGTGKTVLFDALDGRAYEARYKLPGKSEKQEVGAESKKTTIYVVPGQDGLRLDAYSELFTAQDAPDGVIFVAHNGFRTMRGDIAKTNAVEAGFDTVEKYRSFQLEKEREVFAELCAEIRKSHKQTHRKPKWMLVAIAKMDLYDEKLGDASDYYSPECDSPFSTICNRLCESVGKDNFRWDAMPVSAWPEVFEWNDEQVPSFGSLNDQERPNDDQMQRAKESVHAFARKLSDYV